MMPIGFIANHLLKQCLSGGSRFLCEPSKGCNHNLERPVEAQMLSMALKVARMMVVRNMKADSKLRLAFDIAVTQTIQ